MKTQPGLFRHYKGGLYRVLFVAHDSTNVREGGAVVVYLSLTTGRINVRDEAEFRGTVPAPGSNDMCFVCRFEEQKE